MFRVMLKTRTHAKKKHKNAPHVPLRSCCCVVRLHSWNMFSRIHHFYCISFAQLHTNIQTHIHTHNKRSCNVSAWRRRPLKRAACVRFSEYCVCVQCARRTEVVPIAQCTDNVNATCRRTSQQSNAKRVHMLGITTFSIRAHNSNGVRSI